MAFTQFVQSGVRNVFLSKEFVKITRIISQTGGQAIELVSSVPWGLVIKYGEGAAAEIRGGSSVFKLMKGVGHLNIGHVYGAGQVEIGHSSKSSLIQETEGGNLPREWDFRPLCGAVNYSVFRASRGFAP